MKLSSICLVGLPGAGKTSVGRELSTLLGVPFFDYDACLEAVTGLDAKDVIRTDGLSSYRHLERQAIGQVDQLLQKPCVLASGGGTWLIEEFQCYVNRWALSMWLDVEPRIIAARPRVAEREILDLTVSTETQLNVLLTQRRSAYCRSSYRVIVDSAKPASAIAIEVLHLLGASSDPIM